MADPSLVTTAITVLRRELRSGLRRFGVFLAALFLGVFAIAVVGSFTESARRGLLADAASLLGGDIEIRLVHRTLQPEQLAFLEGFGVVSKVASLRTMAFAAGGEGRGLVELKGVDHRYPLYGTAGVDPPQSVQAALTSGGALVEKSLLLRLGLAVGGKLKLGEALFPIVGVLEAEPDRVVRAFSLGPRVMVSLAALGKTGLIRPGSLVKYRYRIRLPAGTEAATVKAAIEQRYPQAGWRVRTWHDAAPRIRRFLDRMGTNLTLLGLCALLVGGLGVSGAVRGYLDSKMLNIATMKCLGATARVVFSSYLLQILLLGALAAGAGLALAASVPFIVKQFAGEALPIPFAPGIFPGIIVTAALFGLLVALLFSLQSLGAASRVRPAILFRGYGRQLRSRGGSSLRLVMAGLTLLLAVLTVFSSSDRRMAAWFIAGALLCFVVFRLATAVVVRLAEKVPKPGSARFSLGLKNIYRRGSPARSVMFSLGLGLTSLVLISQVHVNLSAQVEKEIPRDAPAFFLLDIQTDQVDAFDALAKEVPAIEKSKRFPTLRGRINAIKGVPVARAAIDPGVRWAVRGDRFLSYSDAMPAGTEIVAGTWWSDERRGEGELVSLTADLAEGFGVGIGDTITVNVLGREVVATVASIREVDWSNMQLNFALLFAPGMLSTAPQTHIAAMHVPVGHEDDVYRLVTDRFPNVSVISVREVLENVSRTLTRLGAAFTAVAAVALIVSLLVLAGAMSADQHRRIHDSIIFKVCGATRADIIFSFSVEFLLLGFCAGAIATLAGSLAAWGVITGLMEMPFAFRPQVALATLATAILLTLVLGLAGTWKALGQRPASYLREG